MLKCQKCRIYVIYKNLEWRPFANDKEKIITEYSNDTGRSSNFMNFLQDVISLQFIKYELFIQVQP